MDRQDCVLIPSEDFTAAMTARWIALGNVPSAKLQSLWTTMAETFNRAAIYADKPHSPWLVLEPPTGSGKTQGLCVYAAMVISANARERDVGTTAPIGILITTRTIAQANEVTETVRSLAGLSADNPAVVTKHSDKAARAEQMRAADVLVITHAAYTNALEGLTNGTALASRWTDYVNWTHGPRRLTVIDEALANVVEEHQVTAADLRMAIAYISPKQREAFPEAVGALEQIRDLMTKVAKKSSDSDGRASRVVWRAVADGRVAFPDSLSMGDLRTAMRDHDYDRQALRRDDPLERLRIAKFVDETLAAAEAIMAKWAYYHRIGSEVTFNAAQLLIPPGLPGPVILDATASQNMLWELMEGRAERIETAERARTYDRVTINVARSSGIGKVTMTERGATRIPRLLSHLAKRLPSDRRVLLVVHKANEHIPLAWQHPFKTLSVAHWWALDGKNDWQDFDTVVLFGLPFRPQTWANNMFFALQGLPSSNTWMTEPVWRGHSDIRREIERRQLGVDIIQAVNRVRCRRVVDDQGRSAPAEVFMVLPTGEDGQQLQNSLSEEMPGVKLQAWDFEMDGPSARIRRGSCHEALLAFMRNRPPGDTAMTRVRKELSLTTHSMKDLTKVLRDAAHPLTKALAEIGVSYHSSGVGRRGRSWLLKQEVR